MKLDRTEANFCASDRILGNLFPVPSSQAGVVVDGKEVLQWLVPRVYYAGYFLFRFRGNCLVPQSRKRAQ